MGEVQRSGSILVEAVALTIGGRTERLLRVSVPDGQLFGCCRGIVEVAEHVDLALLVEAPEDGPAL